MTQKDFFKNYNTFKEEAIKENNRCNFHIRLCEKLIRESKDKLSSSGKYKLDQSQIKELEFNIKSYEKNIDLLKTKIMETNSFIMYIETIKAEVLKKVVTELIPPEVAYAAVLDEIDFYKQILKIDKEKIM